MTDSLLDFLIQSAEERRAGNEDAASLKYTAKLFDGTWEGGRNGKWYVKIDGKVHALYDYWGSTSIAKGSKVQVRYANGKYIAAW